MRYAEKVARDILRIGSGEPSAAAVECATDHVRRALHDAAREAAKPTNVAFASEVRAVVAKRIRALADRDVPETGSGYMVIAYWSGLVLCKGQAFTTPDEAWREADDLNRAISIDAIVIEAQQPEQDGSPFGHVSRFAPVPRESA